MKYINYTLLVLTIVLLSISLINAELNINFEGDINPFDRNVSISKVNTGFIPYTGAVTNVDLGVYSLTADWVYARVNWSNIQNVPTANLTNTMKNASGPYLYNDTYTIYFNDTLLNDTIDNRANVTNFVPYDGATRNVNLSDKNISAYMGNFTELYTSNGTLHIGNISISSTGDKILTIEQGVSINATSFVGDGSKLTNISFEGGNAIFNGSVSAAFFNASNYYGGNYTGDNVTASLIIGENITANNVTANNFYGGNYSGDWIDAKLNWSNLQNIPSGYIDTQKNASGPYLYNDSTTIYLNNTLLNITINQSVNLSLTLALYDYVLYTGGTNNLVLTSYNITADFLFGIINWSQITNVPFFITGVTDNPYLFLNDTTIDFNETKLNDTITSLNIDTDTQKNASGPYLYNDSTTIYFNDTYLNATIDERDNNTHPFTQGPYLSNNTTTIMFNESRLNATIEDLAVVGAYNKTVRVIVSGGVGNNITEAIQYEINEIIVTPPGSGSYRFQAAEYVTGDIIDTDRRTHHGVWDIYKNYLINDKTVQTNVTGTDGLYIVTIKYIGQFE